MKNLFGWQSNPVSRGEGEQVPNGKERFENQPSLQAKLDSFVDKIIEDADAAKAIQWAHYSNYRVDELAQVVIDYGDESQALTWATEVSSHLEEMAQIVLESRDAGFAALWMAKVDAKVEEMAAKILASDDFFALARAIFFVPPETYPLAKFKERIVELNRVDGFVRYVNESMNRVYSREEFYSDLPAEVKLGVFV